MLLKQIAEQYGLPEKEFLRRLDGRIEWICEHGVGHTVWYPKGSNNIHGCCHEMCCSKLKKVKQ